MAKIIPQGKVLNIAINATFPEVDTACRSVEEFTTRHGLQNMQFDILLGIREGLVNAVRHGSRLLPDKTIDLEIKLLKDSAVIRITDQGEGFDWRTASSSCPTVFKEGGRGICIMHYYFDSVQFNERGNQVVMTKKLPGPPD